MDEKTILKEIADYYISSGDFNGISLSKLNNYDYEILCNLIDKEKITVISGQEFINPHIRAFEFTTPNEVKKEYLIDRNNYNICLYPIKNGLKNVRSLKDKPYTNLLRKGSPKLDIIYFNVEVLEKYVNNPKYYIYDIGYRGSIYPRDEYSDDTSILNEYIKDYGMAYNKAENSQERAIAVFIDDLSKLDYKKQLFWKSYEITNQKDYYVQSGFIKNLIFGEWVDYVWIYKALVEEMVIINKQCDEMQIPHLFNETFSNSQDIEGYRHILLPTIKNYNDFIVTLEKLIVHNISIKTFMQETNIIRAIDRKDEEGKDKSSLNMVEEWLKLNIRTPENLSEIIIKPLKNIRKKRQLPAHKLIKNQYDANLYKEQSDLMNETYSAVRAIRIFFSNHPTGKLVEVPDYLIWGTNIVNY